MSSLINENACQQCNKILDFTENKPVFLKVCGHRICCVCKDLICQGQILEDNFLMITCPICNKKQEVQIYVNDKLIEISKNMHDYQKNMWLTEKESMIQEIEKLKQDKLVLQSQNLLSSINLTCSVHQDNKIKKYCSQCQCLCCESCLSEHQNHPLKSFKNKDFLLYCDFIQTSLQSIQSEFNTQNSNLKLKHEREIQELQQEYNEKLNQLKSEHEHQIILQENLINQASEFSQKIQNIKNQKNNANDLIQQFKEIEGFVKRNISYIDKGIFKKLNLFNEIILDSLIILDDETQQQFAKMFPDGKQFELIYRATKHSFKSSAFHKECDGKGPHVTLVKSKPLNKIFGGYTDINMTPDYGTNGCKPGHGNSFIFSQREQNQFQKLKCVAPQNEVYHGPGYIAVFGAGHDLHITSDCDVSSDYTWSALGYSYEKPHGYAFQSHEAQTYLAGSYRFLCSEIEVFTVK